MKPIALITSDDNKNYTEFYPIVKKFWELLDFEVKYIKLGDEEYQQISGVPTSLQAQILRLFAPTKYTDRIVLLSDIDMLPLNKQYFMSKLPTKKGQFSIYSADAYKTARYPICYIAAHGIDFEIFKISKNESWESFVLRLHSLNYGWDTDELYMSQILDSSKLDLVKHNRGWLNGIAINRFDRVNWDYSFSQYIDAHCPRPYSKYKQIIDSLESYLIK